MRLLATFLAQRVPATDMNRHPATKIGQGEIHAPITAERGTEQTEQRLVLVNRQKLSIAKRPTLGRKNKAHDSDFRKKWFGHSRLLRRVSNREVSSVVRSRKETGWLRMIQ